MLNRPVCLPFTVALGPYRLAVERRGRAALSDRRCQACVNLEGHRFELREDLTGLRLAEAFLGCLIRLIHFSKGCQQGCVEEAYAHSLATGLVEFAQRNARAWRWFNQLLSEHLPGEVRYDQVVSGTAAQAPAMPARIVVRRGAVALRRISRAQTRNAFGWYARDRREVQLYSGLSGNDLAVVALHEITHAVHDLYAIRKRDKHRNFRRAELAGWFGIMKSSPDAWRWLASLMSAPARPHATQR